MADVDARARLRSALAPVSRRHRVARAIRSTSRALVAAWLVLGVGVVARFGFGAAPTMYLALALAAFVGFIVWSVAKRVDDDLVARLADESHDLDDRLGAAVAFARKSSTTDFERAAISDALTRTTLDATRAVPFVLPRRAPFVALAVFGTAVVLVLPPRSSRAVDRRSGSSSVRAAIDPETLDATRADLERLRRESRGRAIEPDLAALEAVLDALERGTIDSEEAFRRLDDIGRRVASEPRSDERSAALETAATALGDRSRRLDAVVEAMRGGNAAEASRELAEVARAMAAGEVDRRELDRIRESFERLGEAAREREQRRDELLRRRDELRQAMEDEDEPSLLDRSRRELERLERELEELDESRRELERLEREMQEAAEDLSREDSNSAAEDLEDAFEDLNRMSSDEMDEEARREMQQQIEQLREALRRQRSSGGSDGEQERSSGGSGSSGMQRFRLRAGGGEGGRQVIIRSGGSQGSGSEGPGGEDGQGGEQSGTSGSPGQPGEGGEPGGSGSSGNGSEPGSGEGPLVLDVRPGGEGAQAILELPNGGRPSGTGGRGGREPGRDPASYGTDHQPGSLESPTDIDSSGESSHVEGERGSGETRSQVIRGAAASGFAGRGYRDVHSDYSDHAEEMLDRENVPPGYRYYVRRYFQLIRPREESNP